MSELPIFDLAPIEQAAHEQSTSQKPTTMESPSRQLMLRQPLAEQIQSSEVENPLSEMQVEELLAWAYPIYDKFTKFPELPIELRLNIWSFTENFERPPRWFSVGPWIDCHKNIVSPLAVAERGYTRKQQMPVATKVCSEARKEYLRVNSRWNSLSVKFPLYGRLRPSYYYLNSTAEVPVPVNPARDIFYIGDGGAAHESVRHFATWRWKTPKPIEDRNEAASTVAKTAETIPKTIDLGEIVFNRVQHLAVGFWLLLNSFAMEIQFFLGCLVNFKGLRDLTIVLTSKPPSSRHEFDSDDCFWEYQGSALARKINGLLHRYVSRLFDSHDEWKPSTGRKRPTIKIVFHRWGLSPGYTNPGPEVREE